MDVGKSYLHSLPLLHAQVGYGSLGMHGELGYEGKAVTVGGKRFAHALSSHPPAQLRFHRGRRFASFACLVALNDDVPARAPHADFIQRPGSAPPVDTAKANPLAPPLTEKS